MLNLILKDILVQKKTLVFMFMYIVLFVFTFQSLGSGAFSIVIVAVTYQMVMTACNHEEKVGADIMMNSMPIRRRDIVLAKYLSILLYMLACIFIYHVYTSLLTFAGLPLRIYPITPENLIGAIFAVFLMNSIYYPVYFRYGYVKAKIVSFILFFVFFFGTFTLIQAVLNAQEHPVITQLKALFSAMTGTEIFVALLTAAFLILAGSFSLSVHLYKTREF